MLIGIGSLTLLFVLVMISIYLGYNSDKKERLQKLEYLQQLEIEIEADIKTGDFDSALLNTNKLYCKDSCFSSEERAAWDAKREEYIIIIEEKKREVDLQDPNNIFMPASSNDFKGKKVDDVVDQLKGLGFTNITMQVASEDAGLFNKKDTVEHILIGGKTEFTSEDYFNKDTPIVVYYYSKE